MERLTKKTQYGYESEEDGLISMCSDKLGKLEDLEEQIGCPLEVKCKVHCKMFVYDKTKSYWVVDVNYDFFIAEDENGIQQGFSFRNYKKTWWLKADRTE